MPEIRYIKVRRYAADGTLLEERDEPYEVSDEEIVAEEAEQALDRALELDDPKLAAVAVAAKEKPHAFHPNHLRALKAERELRFVKRDRARKQIQQAREALSRNDLVAAIEAILEAIDLLDD